MKTQHLTLAILFVATTIISCGTQNSPVAPQTTQSAQPPAIKPADTVQTSTPKSTRLIDQLDLTPDQRDALRDLQKQYAAYFQTAKQQALYSPDYNDLLTELENAFTEILSAKQKEQYETLKTQTIHIAEELIETRV